MCMHARPELGTSKLATEMFKFAAEEVSKDILILSRRQTHTSCFQFRWITVSSASLLGHELSMASPDRMCRKLTQCHERNNPYRFGFLVTGEWSEVVNLKTKWKGT